MKIFLFVFLIQPGLFFSNSGPSLTQTFEGNKYSFSTFHPEVKTDTTQQCAGIAKSTGEQCKIKTKNANGYCYLHQEQAGENAIPEAESNAKQCLGNAKSTGQQCKNKTTSETGYCYAHKDQAPGYERTEPKTNYTGQCNATTKAGSRCKRSAQSGSRYCWQHQR